MSESGVDRCVEGLPWGAHPRSSPSLWSLGKLTPHLGLGPCGEHLPLPHRHSQAGCGFRFIDVAAAQVGVGGAPQSFSSPWVST